jgi:hypothetical protein
MSAHAILHQALLDAGFRLREGRHLVFSHTAGRTVVMSRTPGDRRAFLNERSDVRRALRAVGAEVTV